MIYITLFYRVTFFQPAHYFIVCQLLCDDENLVPELKKVKTFMEINGYSKNIIKLCHI